MKLSDQRRWRPKKVPPATPKPLVLAPAVAERLPMKVSQAAVELALRKPDPHERGEAFRSLFPPAPRPPGVPTHETIKGVTVAMDDAIAPIYEFAGLFGYGGYGDFELWPGFPILAELTQRPEYRAITETRAKEMTRKWITLTYQGDSKSKGRAKKEKALLEQITSAMEDFKVRDIFRTAAEHDGFFGGGQIYIDTGASDKPATLKSPLPITPETIGKGDLKGLIVVEPMWSYPGYYNSTDPLKANFFSPDYWYVMNKTVHHTRLLTMISAEVPDILKANYSFRGVSMSQRAMPYVQNWLRGRQSGSDLFHSFSIVVLKTVMQAQLAGDPWTSVFARVDVFNATRDNRGAMVIDKETEDMDILAVPLAGVAELVNQSLEQISVVSRIPMIKWAGITPGGLNGGGEDEIRVFYDDILAMQEHLFSDPLKRVIDIIQLHLFGKIDPSVGFKFEPLWQLDEAGEALVQKAKADTHAIYTQEGIVSNEEVRTTLTEDEHSPYYGLDLDPEDVPDPPELAETPPSTSGDPATKAEPRAQARSGV